MLRVFAATALLGLPLQQQDPAPDRGLLIHQPGRAAIERCTRRLYNEPRQALEMRCRISDGRAEDPCTHLNPTPETSEKNLAAAQCLIRATRWTHRDGSPASSVSMTATYTLGER